MVNGTLAYNNNVVIK